MDDSTRPDRVRPRWWGLGLMNMKDSQRRNVAQRLAKATPRGKNATAAGLLALP